MEIWRARPLLIAHSSSFALFKKTPQCSFQTLVRYPPVASAPFALFKKTPQRSFQTLVRCPPVASARFALFKKTPQRSFQTLVRCPPVASSPFVKKTPQRSFQTLVRWPPVASSCYLRHCLFVSQPQRHQPLPFVPQAPAVVRTLSLLSSEQQLACSENAGYQQHLLEVEQEKQNCVIPVKTYFLCTDIDLKSLQAQHAFNNVITPNSHSTIFAICTRKDPHGLEAVFGKKFNCQYMVVFQYGSIVLFNVPDHEADAYLKTVERHASGLLPEIKKDDYLVVIKPTLETWVQGGLDSVMLRNLSIDGIGTVGSVLGQSIALDYYIGQVKQIITKLEEINCKIVKQPRKNSIWASFFQPTMMTLVWDASSRLDFICHKLEIFKRSHIANDAQIWECLSTRFGLTKIISTLDHDHLQAMIRALKLKIILAETDPRALPLGRALAFSFLFYIYFKYFEVPDILLNFIHPTSHQLSLPSNVPDILRGSN